MLLVLCVVVLLRSLSPCCPLKKFVLWKSEEWEMSYLISAGVFRRNCQRAEACALPPLDDMVLQIKKK